MATSKAPEDAAAPRIANLNSNNAVKNIYKIARYMSNPGTLGKSELGETLGELALFLDGVVLPAGNNIVKSIKPRIGTFSFTNKNTTD